MDSSDMNLRLYSFCLKGDPFLLRAAFQHKNQAPRHGKLRSSFKFSWTPFYSSQRLKPASPETPRGLGTTAAGYLNGKFHQAIAVLGVKFADLGQEDGEDSFYTGGKIPPVKTISFKGERKKPQSWFQRRFSGQMSYVDDLSDGEFVTAVAAAASAIKSLEERDGLKQRSDEELRKSLTKTGSKREADLDKPADFSKISRWFSGKEAVEDRRSAGERYMRKSDEELRRSLTKSKIKREDSNEKPSDHSKISRWFSGKETKDVRLQGEGSMRKSTTPDRRFWEESLADLKEPEKATRMKPAIKKTPTSSNKYQNDRSQGRFEQVQVQEAGQTAPSNKKPQAFISGNEKWEGYTTDSSKVKTEADIWEKAKMDKIKNRYDKLIATILEWENEKKAKAKRRFERKEREIEEKRARVLQDYRSEMSRIDKIAREAREAADETRRNDETKTMEKAKVYRLKGKIPKACFCC